MVAETIEGRLAFRFPRLSDCLVSSTNDHVPVLLIFDQLVLAEEEQIPIKILIRSRWFFFSLIYRPRQTIHFLFWLSLIVFRLY